MQTRGHARDYTFSFLARPGRKLTPACIKEIEQGKIGRAVEPASDAETDAYISKSLAQIRDGDAEYGPLSTFQIGEALGWIMRSQSDLLQDETQQVEFKICIKTSEDDLHAYAKTFASLANNRGGYLFFGIGDDRFVCGIQDADFLSFDWDRLSAIVREKFQPDVRWLRTLTNWKGKRLGVIYVREAEWKPVIAAAHGKKINKGDIYFRYRGSNDRIAVGDLLQLLTDRDEKIRQRLLRDLVESAKEPPAET